MVFEYCDQDLKKYFDTCRGRVDKKTVQVATYVYYLTAALIVIATQYIYSSVASYIV